MEIWESHKDNNWIIQMKKTAQGEREEGQEPDLGENTETPWCVRRGRSMM